jgi:predicted trehalose synthase
VAACREAYLDGYAAGGGRDARADGVLLRALELDKALYEVVYEFRHRPDWLGIPLHAVGELLGG